MENKIQRIRHLKVIDHLKEKMHKLPKSEWENTDAPHETSLVNLEVFCNKAATLAGTLEITKLARWVGYIQGVMISKGWLNLEEERDYTRPIFTGKLDEE